MHCLNTEIQKCVDKDERLELMFSYFKKLKAKVDEILLFGPCNNAIAEETANAYYYKKQCQNKGSLFPVRYSKKELQALPAVIANKLSQSDDRLKTQGTTLNTFKEYFKRAYLYGTGTCEYYAIVGAYFLATEFDVSMSIETLYSTETHTYIRVHTTPEYIVDFWGELVCEYNDTLSWNEFFGEFPRNSTSETKTNIHFSESSQLIGLGKDIFSEQNEQQRLSILQQVKLLVAREHSSEVVPEELQHFSPITV